MSLADYLGPVILLTLLGLAALLAVVAWVVLYLVPKSHEIATRNRVTADVLDFNRKARTALAAVVFEYETNPLFKDAIPEHAMSDVWALQLHHSDARVTRKGNR